MLPALPPACPTLRTVPAGASSSQGSTRAVTPAAVSQPGEGPAVVDTAMVRAPCVEPVRAAPTMPECRMAWPVLGPLLIPERAGYASAMAPARGDAAFA